jgi:hypothetical protein
MLEEIMQLENMSRASLMALVSEFAEVLVLVTM